MGVGDCGGYRRGRDGRRVKGGMHGGGGEVHCTGEGRRCMGEGGEAGGMGEAQEGGGDGGGAVEVEVAAAGGWQGRGRRCGGAVALAVAWVGWRLVGG